MCHKAHAVKNCARAQAAFMLSHAHKLSHTHTHKLSHTHTNSLTHTHIHTTRLLQKRAHNHTHTHTHTYTHTHTHTHAGMVAPGSEAPPSPIPLPPATPPPRPRTPLDLDKRNQPDVQKGVGLEWKMLILRLCLFHSILLVSRKKISATKGGGWWC
jgi:hypothetical protein